MFSQKKININLNKQYSKIFDNLNNKNKFFFISNLKIDNEIIAACFNIHFQDIFYYFIPVFLTKKFEKFKIEKILNLNLIEFFIKKRIKVFDFGLGAEKYKKHFSNSNLDLFRYCYFKVFKGLIFYIILKLFLLQALGNFRLTFSFMRFSIAFLNLQDLGVISKASVLSMLNCSAIAIFLTGVKTTFSSVP